MSERKTADRWLAIPYKKSIFKSAKRVKYIGTFCARAGAGLALGQLGSWPKLHRSNASVFGPSMDQPNDTAGEAFARRSPRSFSRVAKAIFKLEENMVKHGTPTLSGYCLVRAYICLYISILPHPYFPLRTEERLKRMMRSLSPSALNSPSSHPNSKPFDLENDPVNL
jgi:hypothetical protein